MLGELFRRVLRFMGLEEEAADGEPQVSAVGQVGPGRAKVVNLHSTRQFKLVIVRPLAFEEVQGIVDHLRSRRPVIVELDGAEKELVRRMVDFLSGAVYALGGSMRRVGEAVFVLAPSEVEIASRKGEDILSKELLASRRYEPG